MSTPIITTTTKVSVVIPNEGLSTDCGTADLGCSKILPEPYCKHWTIPPYCQGTAIQCSYDYILTTTCPVQRATTSILHPLIVSL
mmetsp:Transcript_13785/g.13568  ORF Transcript_13785/g.13568 Transcript_13785/m.13568 type:complete len:85 (+) Transcript_13785:152-406(+)